MENNYRILFKPASVVESVDILISEDSEEGESDFAINMTQFESITPDGLNKLVYVCIDDIGLILPI